MHTDKGGFATYKVEVFPKTCLFLEMLDVLNEELSAQKGEDPVHFDHDCREGICGTCSLYIDGKPHGPLADNYMSAPHAILS
jgi:succinate dehydrogenase / fumarate reductase, iron-sulfur subunit